MEPEEIEDLREQLTELEDKLEEYLADLRVATSPNTIDEYQLAVTITERKIKYFKGKINQYEAKSGRLPSFYITVVSGREGRIRRNLGDDLFSLLVPSNHDDNDVSNWIPFDNSANGGGSVRSILSSFKLAGYPIVDNYVEGINYQPLVTGFMNSPNDNIAIIDLLSMDSENEMIISLFNHQDIAALIIPENIGLDSKIRQFVDNLKIKLSEIGIYNIQYLIYNTTMGKPILWERLRRLLEQYRPITNRIKLPGGDDKFRGLNTGFN